MSSVEHEKKYDELIKKIDWDVVIWALQESDSWNIVEKSDNLIDLIEQLMKLANYKGVNSDD